MNNPLAIAAQKLLDSIYCPQGTSMEYPVVALKEALAKYQTHVLVPDEFAECYELALSYINCMPAVRWRAICDTFDADKERLWKVEAAMIEAAEEKV